MKHPLRAEVFKLRTTRSTYGMPLGLLGLVAFAIVLHAATLPVERIDTAAAQLSIVFCWGERFGALFAALLGALSVTSEFRHGTIRPTLLASPRRTPVVVAKMLAAAAAGLAIGTVGALFATGVSLAVLTGRGVDIALTAGDFTRLIGGTAIAAALWAAIGVGLGAIVRSQVPTLVGVTAWLLLIETLIVENLAGVGRYLPGATAQALSGQNPATLLPFGWAALLLASYAAIAVASGSWATARRDVA
jgi:ABC-type transport system involved in multi-copper enzyme maturation permease subunit